MEISFEKRLNANSNFSQLDANRWHHDKKEDKLSRSHSFNMTYYGQKVQRLPNVWLASMDTPSQQEFVHNLEIYANEKQDTPPIDDQEGAALMYLAGGAWFGRWNLTTPVPADGILSTSAKFDIVMNTKPWSHRFGVFKKYMSAISDYINDNIHDPDPFTAPMDPIDGLGNQVFYAPPVGPMYLGDIPRRIVDANRRIDEMIKIQDWIREVEKHWKFPVLWSIPMTTYGQKKTWLDPLKSGQHVKHGIADTRANILLNLRCNAKLDRIKPYPYKRTCCTDYGIKPLTQLGIVALGIIYLVACLVGEILDLYHDRSEPHWGLFNMKVGSFILALLMCYYADRTQMMAKGEKLWLPIDFAVLCAPCIAILLLTIRRSRSPISMDMSLLTKETNESFLSRHQTEEWKGWMQAVILIYHWTGAIKGSKSIYILIRLCVAAYLFQTGYGHTLYFVRKNDFSFRRVATVLLRLNVLSCSLAYVMDTDYMFYYFSPLVSFWFLVVYATMAVGGKRFNSDPQIVLSKICISGLLISAIFMCTPFTQFVFGLLKTVFNIQWSYETWQYRVTLDMFIVYAGMLTAVVHNEMKQTSVHLGLRIILAFAGLFVTMYYFKSTLHLRHSVYKTWHPLVSFIPIIAFITLRNISATIRNYHSKAMAWLGRCSLETYILQYHILMAADTEGVLIVDGLFGDGTVLGDRWRTLIIIVPLFLWVSNAAAISTGYVVELIMDSSEDDEEKSTSSYAWLDKVPGYGQITAPKVRIACILLVMWILNILTPGHGEVPAPSGGHDVTVAPTVP